jgi:MFS family permease
VVVLAGFVWIETKVPEPMFRLELFRIRAFSAGNVAVLLGAMGRGGLQFLLIIWLQGIWLPQHGYSFEQTPLYAGLYMIPLTVGFLLAAPASGVLSDRFGARPFATGGLLLAAAGLLLLELLPMNFSYPWFALLIFVFALGTGMFSSPNQAGVMNSLPPNQRGAGAGMFATFQNSASVLSIGVFFTVLTLGIASALPSHLYAGLVANGLSPATARSVSHVPPIGSLFAAFLGINPVTELVKPSALHALSHAHQAVLTGRTFFPLTLSAPFAKGLHLALDFAAGASVIGAIASWMRGGRYVHTEAKPLSAEIEEGLLAVADATTENDGSIQLGQR